MTRQELNKYIRTKEGTDKQLLEDYFRLKYYYIPQLKVFVESKGSAKMFPHMLKERKLNWFQKLIIKLLK